MLFRKKYECIEFKVGEHDFVIKFAKKNRERLPTLFKEYVQIRHDITNLKKETEHLQSKNTNSKKTEQRLKEIQTEIGRARKKKRRCKAEVDNIIEDKNFTRFSSKQLDVLVQYFGAL